MKKNVTIPENYIEKRDADDRSEVERNEAEFGTVYNPHTDSASRIHYLSAKYGERGWAKSLDKIEHAERERLGLSSKPQADRDAS